MAQIAQRVLIYLGVVFVMACPDPCSDDVRAQVASPDGKLKAVVFVRNCGATADFSTQVAVLGAADSFSDKTLFSRNESRIAFVADTDHGFAPSQLAGGPLVRARWLSNRDLEIGVDHRARVFKAVPAMASASIRYVRF